MKIENDFAFQGLPPVKTDTSLGPLDLLQAKWTGQGFNQIWRPFYATDPRQDRYLELNLTTEELEFDPIPGEIPNRGLRQEDISLAGLYYLQQIKDRNIKVKNRDDVNVALHLETGMWVMVPATTNPKEPPTVVRMASIAHGATIQAQGTACTIYDAPTIPPVSIKPFWIGFPNYPTSFPESNLCIPTAFRSPPPQLVGITQPMVDDPNSVLRTAIAGQVITETTILKISSQIDMLPAPDAGGGTDNIAFLAGTAGPNALAAPIDATFWIETVKEPSGQNLHQLQ